jgi:hypothetical protein
MTVGPDSAPAKYAYVVSYALPLFGEAPTTVEAECTRAESLAADQGTLFLSLSLSVLVVLSSDVLTQKMFKLVAFWSFGLRVLPAQTLTGGTYVSSDAAVPATIVLFRHRRRALLSPTAVEAFVALVKGGKPFPVKVCECNLHGQVMIFCLD